MNGIIIINKEKAWTSNDVVQKVKHTFNEKVGHTGTLDPMATGVLPLLVGKGTLLSKYLINHDKEYIATLKLGAKTTTGDAEGKIIEQKDINNKCFNIEYVKEILECFIGEQSQIPPIYSAIKVNGKKLYEYARQGKQVEITPREIEIYNIELISINQEEKTIKFKVNCSKGTYIRSLCEDIAEKMGTLGSMQELHRTKVGIFDIKNAVKIYEIIENFEDKTWIEKHFITIESFFKDKDKLVLNSKKHKLFINGVKLNCSQKDDIYRIYDENNHFIGIGVVKDFKLKRDIC